jgi:uncharacterized membrane protein
MLLPLAVAWTLRRRGRAELARSVTAAAAVIVAAFAPFLVLAPHGLWVSVWGQISRPMEIESLGASVLMLTHHAGVAMSHGGYDVSGRLVGPLTILTTAAQIGALLGLWTAFMRRPLDNERLVRYAAACVCAFIAFAKVLSPQYLIWLVPLVGLIRGWRGLRATVLLGASLILTQVLYPERFYTYVYHHQLAWLVLLRDLVLVALVGALVLELRPLPPAVPAGGRLFATTLRRLRFAARLTAC